MLYIDISTSARLHTFYWNTLYYVFSVCSVTGVRSQSSVKNLCSLLDRCNIWQAHFIFLCLRESKIPILCLGPMVPTRGPKIMHPWSPPASKHSTSWTPSCSRWPCWSGWPSSSPPSPELAFKFLDLVTLVFVAAAASSSPRRRLRGFHHLGRLYRCFWQTGYRAIDLLTELCRDADFFSI